MFEYVFISKINIIYGNCFHLLHMLRHGTGDYLEFYIEILPVNHVPH